MQIDVFEGAESLTQLRSDWEAVYDADPDAHYFTSWTWMNGWLRHLKFPATILAARPEGSAAYVAFLPLWLETIEEKTGGFYNKFNFGGNHFSDYAGILCRPDFEGQAIPALARKLKQLSWAQANFGELRMSERRISLLLQGFAGKEFKVVEPNSVEDNIDQNICPFTRLPGSWDEYLNNRLSANSRQKLRRLLRQLDSSTEYRITHADKETFDRDLATLLKFWSDRWGERRGSRLPFVLRNYRNMLRHAFESGALFMPVLWHGDRPVCVLATFMDARKKAFLFFVVGRDRTFDGPSSGLMLHAHSIRHAIANGYTTYDFLRGNETYKYSFGVEERRLKSIRVSTKDGHNLGGKLDKRSLKLVLEKSLEHFRTDRDLQAEKGLRQAIGIDPLNEEALYTLGRIVAKRGAHAAAIKLFRKLLATHPDSSRTWFRLARSLQEKNEHAEAALAYCDGITREPEIPLPYLYLGQSLTKLGLTDVAMVAFDAATALKTDLPGIAAARKEALQTESNSLRRDKAPDVAVVAQVRDRAAKLPAIAAALNSRPPETQAPGAAAPTRDQAIPPMTSGNDAAAAQSAAPAENGAAAMHIDLIDSVEALNRLQANWDAIYDSDPDAHLFISWVWMSKWLPGIDLPWVILAARPEGAADYVAFFPLWIKTRERKDDGFYNEINMGGNYYADYTGIVCGPEFEAQAVPALVREIKRLHWTNFRLKGLKMSERRIGLLLQEFSTDEFDVVDESQIDDDKIDQSICPFARLPGDWDSYLGKSLSANTRQKLRRLLRQMEADTSLRITHADKDTFDCDLDTLLKLWAERWEPRIGKRMPGILQNNRTMLRHAFENGRLFLPILWQGEKPLGALAVFIDEKKKSYLFFMAGYDQSFEGPSSGLLLHAHSIRHAIRNGFTTYDFLRGNEPYKYSFGAEEHRIKSLVVSTKDKKNLGGKLEIRGFDDALQRCRAHLRADRNKAAERGVRQVLEIDPRNVDTLYMLGRILAKRGDHLAAIEQFKILLAAAPDTSKAWFSLGRSLRARGELVAAAIAYCEGIERGSEIPQPYFDLGKILVKLDLFDQAIAAIDAAAELKPDFPDVASQQMKALEARDQSASKGQVQASSTYAHVAERVGKLPAVSKFLNRSRQQEKPLVLEWQRKETASPVRFGHPKLPPNLFAPSKG